MELLTVKNVRLLLFLSWILYPKWPVHVFPLYMFVLHHRLKKLTKRYEFSSVPDEFFDILVKRNTHLPFDSNNTILLTNSLFKPLKKLITTKDAVLLYLTKTKVQPRLTTFILVDQHLPTEILVSDTLKCNLQNAGINEAINLRFTEISKLKIAAEVCVALVSTYNDVPSSASDVLLKNYFSTPRILNVNDIIPISVKEYGGELFYINKQLNSLKVIYLKCSRVFYDDSEVTEGSYVCVSDRTALKQVADVQSYLPKCLKICVKDFKDVNEIGCCVINSCPFGLEESFEKLRRAVRPFLSKSRKLDLQATFLLQAPEGSGLQLLPKILAEHLGVGFYKFYTIDITSHVYAQTESKLRTLFFHIKLTAPCILSINNFENFGKNNEGEYDQRIINSFKQELSNLFEANKFPVILICISNTKDVHIDLKRSFLEIFTAETPTTHERAENLKWILAKRNLTTEIDVQEIAAKCHGFLFEDLEALVFHARKFGNSRKGLAFKDFIKAIDLMQSKYSQSLGAPKVPKVEWSDVGGLEDVKKEIIQTIQLPLQHPEFSKISGLGKSGILLYGPPGTGKTLMAKAVATECNLCFLSVKGPELLNMYVGQSEQNIREVFERARQASPCIIFFDELDSLAPNRGHSGDSGGVMDRVVSQLLAEMDGLNQDSTLFIIGATNRPDLIDPALLRPGRFDKLLYIGPATDERSKGLILKALTRKFKLSEEVVLEKVVEMCPSNITGADFYGLCSNAWMSAVRKIIMKYGAGNHRPSATDVIVDMDDFNEAIHNIRPSVKAEDLHYFSKLKQQYATNR